MTILFMIIIALAFMQPSGNRRVACLFFAGSIFTFDQLCGDLPGEIYFLAGAIDSAIIYKFLDELKPMPFIAYVLQRFCAASIILNCVGWRMFENEMTGTPYVISFQIYHLLAIVLFVYWGPYDYLKRIGNVFNIPLFNSMGDNIYLEAETWR